MGDPRKHNTLFFEYNPADPKFGGVEGAGREKKLQANDV